MKLRRACRYLWHDRGHFTSVLVLCFTPVVVFCLTEWFYQPFGLIACGTGSSLVNIVLITLLMLLGWLVCRQLRWSVILVSLLCLLLALTNYYLLRFRSTPLLPWDLYSWRTGLNVAAGYDYRLDTAHICLVLLFFAWCVLAWRCQWCCRLRCRLYFGLLLGWGLAWWLTLWLLGHEAVLQRLYFERNLYNTANTVAHDGILATQIINLRQLFLTPPLDYSPAKAQRILANYAAPEATPAVRPHIIAIMDEAFADLSVYGDLQTHDDPLPRIHALQASSAAQVGFLHVSVKGGNTANTEWEFLTGGTMAFLPPGAVAYLQFSQKNAPSLAHQLAALGYQTTAIHPYHASGWRRETVYPELGFQQLIFDDDFPEAKIRHGFISDESSFDKIIEVFKQKNPGTPQFIWNVTMQNHSGYGACAAGMPRPIRTQLVSDDNIDCYLSLMAESDRQFGRLLDYFAIVDEPVVVVFFGDHQPGDQILAPLRGALARHEPSVLAASLSDPDYVTPYVIWRNPAAGALLPEPGWPPEASGAAGRRAADTSSNYLSLDVVRAAGLPLTAFQTLLAAARTQYPLITSQLLPQAGGAPTSPPATQAVEDYRLVQYWWLARKR